MSALRKVTSPLPTPASHSRTPSAGLGHCSGSGWDPSFYLTGAGMTQTPDFGMEGPYRRGGHRWEPDVSLGGRGLTRRL